MKKVANLFAAIVFFTILFTSCSSKKNDSNSSSSTESTTPSWTCKNCGGHSYNNHETVPDMEVCNSCGMGN